MEEVLEGKDFSFPKQEECILDLWRDLDAFHEQNRRNADKPVYSFYDGPPFATGLPHYGHILAGTIKDIVTRYACQTGYSVERRFGWDTHGLPVEFEIDKKLGIKSRDDVLAMGIDKYNEECRAIVMTYSAEWEKTVTRLGRWIDFENDYKTLNPSFMESVWWVFKTLWEKGLVYKGFKVMPYSAQLNTTLSNFEAGLNYKDVSDPAVMVTFPIQGDAEGAAFIAWTTTPWTLPSNLALCVHPTLIYVRAKDPKSGKVYVVGKSRLAHIPGAVPKKAKKAGKKAAGDAPAPAAEEGWTVLSEMPGSELGGLRYSPLFPYFQKELGETAYKVCVDTYVTDDSGTGVVHQAPAFGEDDYRVCIAHGVVEKGGFIPCPVDANGRFEDPVTEYAGVFVKDADKDICKALKSAGRLFNETSMVHSYPYCWRSESPLIYKAVPSWFVNVAEIKTRLVANNDLTRWVPAEIGEGRFKNWLEAAHDWAVSRSRFWGTPIPIWISDDGEEVVVIGSIAELEAATGETVTDLHRHFIDHLKIPSQQGKGMLTRVDDVFDCWFESGSMPYAQAHYPFENKEKFEASFPADFVAEGIDQTRGWFYTLMVLSTALFDKPAFKNLVVNGMVLAADGRKMSKREKNYPPPSEVLDLYGADALRLYLINSPVVRGDTLKFKKEAVFAVVKDVFLPWYNGYRFLVQNVQRHQADTGEAFDPQSVDLGAASNVLDKWIGASSRALTALVRKEMEAYRLYTVVPLLVKFINDLTNIYVRYNRKRLKGGGGREDALMALVTLYDVLLKVCVTMAPFTPFLTETMYQNLRKAAPARPSSVHFVDMPPAGEALEGDAQIQTSVTRMQSVIELGRTIRERHTKPLKFPLREVVVVHPDAAFLRDLEGELAPFVLEELNVRQLTACPDPTKYADLKLMPDLKVLGAKLGKAMGKVAAGLRAMGTEQVLALQKAGSVDVDGHTVLLSEVKVQSQFKPPEGVTAMDAYGDGDVLVVLDLAEDEELLEAGVAREVVNRFQKLRKKALLTPGDTVEMFFQQSPEHVGTGVLQRVLSNNEEYLAQALAGGRVLPGALRPAAAVVIASEEVMVGSGGMAATFTAQLTVPCVAVDDAEMLALCGGDDAHAGGVGAYLVSRDMEGLRSEAAGGGVSVRLVNREPVRVEVGKHMFWSAADIL